MMVATRAKTGTKSLGDSSTAAYTNGWDTVFAIRYSDVNAAIVSQKSSPKSFDQNNPPSFGVAASELKGDFGDWQIAEGGDGKNLWMTLPLNNATLTVGTSTYPSDNSTFSGTVTIEVQLEYLPQPPSTAQTGSTEQKNNLVVNTTAQDPNTPVVSVRPVSSTNLNPPPPSSEGSIIETFIQSSLQEWLNNNLQAFNNVFAVVDLNQVAKEDYFQWLKPTYISYACTDLGSLDTSVFGVLALTGDYKSRNIDPTQLAHQISPNTIPPSNPNTKVNAGFLISQERFLSQIVLPGMPYLCVGATTENFVVTGDSSQITNNSTLNFQPFTVTDTGQVAHPTIAANNFTLTLFDTYMQLEFTDFTYDHAVGVTINLNYSATAEMFLSSDNHLLLQQTGSTTSGSVVTAPSVTWTEFAVGIAASILGGIAGGWAGEAVSGTASVVESEGSVIIDETVTNSSTVTEQNVVDSMEDDADDAGDEMDQSDATDPPATKQKGWFSRNWKKILGGVIGGTVGMTLGQIVTIMQAMAQNDYANVPTLDDWSQEASTPIYWPDSTANGYTLQTVALNGSFQMGILVNFDHSTTS